ncbi:MAG: hypothetical protein AABX01_07385 [Candidatus Micrarchaeota archaeon]
MSLFEDVNTPTWHQGAPAVAVLFALLALGGEGVAGGLAQAMVNPAVLFLLVVIAGTTIVK